MTKIFAYGFRADEEIVLVPWLEKHPDVQVDTTNQLLTLETVGLAEGYDIINLLQVDLPLDEAVLIKIRDFGIKTINYRSAGMDDLPFELLKKYNFNVSTVPNYSPNAIAEHTMIQMARLFRHMKQMDIKVYKHNFKFVPTIGREVRKQTIGVIGTGKIGREVIKIAQGFGAKVIAYSPRHDAELEAQGIYVDTLDELYAQADGITVHAPAIPETYHMIDAAAIAKMKDQVVIINTARGPLVDIDAVVAGLDSGKIDGFSLDVYEKELGLFKIDWEGKDLPDATMNDLITRENVIVSPHTSFYTWTAAEEMVWQSLDAGLTFLAGGVPEQAVKL